MEVTFHSVKEQGLSDGGRHSAGETGEVGSDSDSSSSHLGIKGGGTLKTCAVCIEDYKWVPMLPVASLRMSRLFPLTSL